MANKETLREYLVALGFKVDDRSFKIFDKTVEDTGKTVTEVGLAVSGTAFAIEKFVSNYARQLEHLYYVSLRTKASVGNIQALQFGAEQIGLSAEGIKGTLEGMARVLRTNPGLFGLLKSLGVQTAGRDRTQVLTDLVEQLRKMPFYQASAIASLFGIDSDTLFMLEKGLEQLKQAEETRRKLAQEAGVDLDAEARAAKDFENATRQLTSSVDVLKLKLEADLLPVALKIVESLKDVAHWFYESDKVTQGWTTRITGLVAVLGTISAAKAGLGLLRGLLTGGGAGAAGGAAAGTVAKGLAAVRPVPVIGTGVAIGLMAKAAIDSFAQLNYAQAAWGAQVNGMWNDLAQGKYGAKAGGPKPVSRLPIGVRQNNPGDLRKWGNQPVVNGFAKFDTPLQGLSAMAANLLNYQKQGFTSVSSIISRWAPPNENDTASYIAEISKKLGVSSKMPLNLSDPAVLRDLMTAMIHRETGYDPYQSNLIDQAVRFRLGGGTETRAGVMFQQHTEINVKAGGEPQQVARAIGNEQQRVNGDLVRNLSGAVQ